MSVSCAEEQSHERAWRGLKYLLRREAPHFANYLYQGDRCKVLVTGEVCGFACRTSSIHMLK